MKKDNWAKHPYREYTCKMCGIVFLSRSNHAPTICLGHECQRKYYNQKLIEHRRKKKEAEEGLALVVPRGDWEHKMMVVYDPQDMYVRGGWLLGAVGSVMDGNVADGAILQNHTGQKFKVVGKELMEI